MLAVMVAGCAMPRYAIPLDDVLDQLNHPHHTRYGFTCTTGAHRGASETHRENTMAALRSAETNNAYGFIEFDVQYTKDAKIVVFHDKRLLRLFGSLRTIGNTTFDDLSNLTEGEIVAYDDAMDALSKRLNIEVKSQGDFEEDKRLVDEVVADIRIRKRDKDVLISSISGDVIAYVNDRYPGITTGQVFWLTSSTYLHVDRLTERLYEEIGKTHANYLMLHVANLRNIDDLLRLKPRGKTIVFWDFDDTMYLVHKDLSDRLWGDSSMKTFCRFVRYKLARRSHSPLPGE